MITTTHELDNEPFGEKKHHENACRKSYTLAVSHIDDDDDNNSGNNEILDVK